MATLSNDLAGLSSAEDFFAYFDLPYDPRILAACRLHILKRFHDNIAAVAELNERDDDAQRTVYREQLERAYADFVSGPALGKDAFPRLARMKGAFIALSAVRLPKKPAPPA
jgi:nitrogenase-stabilizing/protective protein